MSAFRALKDHLMTAITTSAVLGSATMLITTKVNDARQDTQLEAALKVLPEIQREIRLTREGIIRLEAKEELKK